jgi:methionyl aminopeptidase
MKPGQCFTIEPMINEGTHRDEQWPDNWTAVTRDGKRSAQFEHTILVTETGFEVLTLGVEWDVVMDGLKPVEASSSS